MNHLVSAALVVTTALPVTAQSHKDIVDTAVAAGSFKTLVTAVKAAGLVDVLKSRGPFTVFAPTDRAFAQIPKKTLRSLLQPHNRDQLKAILLYHVVKGRVLAKDVVKLDRATTVGGQRVAIDTSKGVRIDSANVVKTDIRCTNGVIHVIDRVLMPATDNVVAIAKKAGKFGTLIQAAAAAGLVDALTGKGPITVFAPTDAAFAKIPKKTLGSLLERRNRSKLAAILKYHVVKGRVYSDEAIIAAKAKTLQRDGIQFAIRNGRFQVNKSKVIANDIQASNGVIHVIDTVLMPPKPKGRKIVGVTLSQPSAALAYQLGLDRGRTLLVTSVSGNAKSAGLKKYDILTKIDGQAATNRNLDAAKARRDFGEAIAFRVQRGGKAFHLNVPVGSEN